jgi:hypothetical protein
LVALGPLDAAPIASLDAPRALEALPQIEPLPPSRRASTPSQTAQARSREQAQRDRDALATQRLIERDLASFPRASGNASTPRR